MPPATREAPAPEPGAGAGRVRKTSPQSVAPGKADFGGINVGSNSSNSNDSEDLPVLVGRPARDLEVSGALPALQSERTRSKWRDLIMSTSCADTLLAYAIRTVETKRTMEEEAAEIEQAHDSLLEERLEKGRECLKNLERRGVLLEQREDEQDSHCPLAVAVEPKPELSIPSPIGKKPSDDQSGMMIRKGIGL